MSGSRTSHPDGAETAVALSRSRVGTRAQGSVTGPAGGRIMACSRPPATRMSAQRAQKASTQAGSKWRPLSARMQASAASKDIAAL